MPGAPSVLGEATATTSELDRLGSELEALRFSVERLRLRDKADLPTILGVASVARPDGASSVARSLATVLAADPHLRVCLVRLNRLAVDRDARDRPGVVDVLGGACSVEDALAATPHPRLQLLTFGRADHPRVDRLHHTRSLERLFEQLESSFEHVVVELPPLLASSDALVIASYCRACVVVLEHGVTTRGELREALDSLGEVRVLGVVMDRVQTRVPGFLLRMFAE